MNRHKVMLGIPGPRHDWDAFKGMLFASQGQHEINLANYGEAAGNFDALWCAALNGYNDGELTHFAMLHADVYPQDPGWLDVMLEEMDKFGVGLLSAAIAIKDNRGLVSAGIANPDDVWLPMRRLTMTELMEMPETFGAEDFGYPGHCLLHNNGCWIADLSLPQWQETNERGQMIASFQFPRQNIKHAETGNWYTMGESEDWYFSRMAHELGIKSKITRKVRLLHHGGIDYPNWITWGKYKEGDEDNRKKWDKNATAISA